MRPTVEIRYPDGRSETVQLTRSRTVIGRSPNADIRINDNRVSREHCALEVEDRRIYVVDLGGSNGTWLGSVKLLANLREPFPRETVVHVGPAQVRNVTGPAPVDMANDLESQAFAPLIPQPPRDGGVRQAAPPQQLAAVASVDLSEQRFKLNPGERGSLQLTISNQSKIVDHYTLSVTGVPATWITLPRGGLELLPRQSDTLNLDFHPPRTSRTSAGSHPVYIAVLNRQGQVVAEARADLEILPFDNLIVDVRPNPYQSRSGGVMVLTVENQGNAQTEYRVDVVEPSDSVEAMVEPQVATVAPQQSRQSQLRLRPRKRIWVGQPKRMPMTVTVTSNLQSVSATPVYTQQAMIPNWVPIIMAMACCVLIPLFSLMLVNPAMDWLGQRQTLEAQTAVAPTLAAVATLTAQPTDTPVPDLAATVTEAWLDEFCNGDRMSNREKLQRELEVCELDTDGDGLTDYDEVYVWGTDPKKRDTSGDGLPDGEVVRLRLYGEPRDWYSCLSPLVADANNDNVPNGIHIQRGTNPCGLEATATPAPTPVPDFGLGGQIRSADNLSTLQDARMTWVKVQLRYSPGANVESTVRDFQQFKDYKLLISVVGHPEQIRDGGPGFYRQFAEFLGQLAFVADAIEVWNEPNIEREWPAGQINPADYTEMLRLAYQAIKARNPTTLVISAAPSPTGVNNETVMSDDRFIQGMYAAGARNYMDCIGTHFNAGATPPNETNGHPAGDHYSWYFMPMLNLYWDTFNPPGATPQVPLCFTEIGFLTDHGFPQKLAQLGATGFLWAQNNTLFNQSIWLADALQRACLSGKVKLFIVWNVDFTETYDAQDPQGGYAIMRPDGSCPSCDSLRQAVGTLRQQGCMA